MKLLKIAPVVYILLLLQPQFLFSQVDDTDWNLMVIREDKVFPSKTNHYEKSLTDLKEFLAVNNIEGFNYFTHMQSDYVFTHVFPLHKLEDLNKGIHEYVLEKEKNIELDLIFSYMNEAISSYHYYVVQYKPELSYIPKGNNWGFGSPYRKWSYFHFQPGTEKDIEQLILAYKNLYIEYDIEMGFRVFEGFIGLEQPVYIFTTWAENPTEYHKNLEKTSGIIAVDGSILWAKMMEYVQQTNAVEGWFLPQYSYAPNLIMAN